jgi:RNA recognition motif-containing protein
MPDETELHQAEAAFLFQAKWFSTKPTIEALNGTQLEGRTLIVNEGDILKNGGCRDRHSDRDLSHSQGDRKLGKTRFT